MPDIELPAQNSRYCQLLMLAKKGQILMLTAEKIACPAAKAALGLGPLPEKISTGEMLYAIGLFSSKGSRQNNKHDTQNKTRHKKSRRRWTAKRLSYGT